MTLAAVKRERTIAELASEFGVQRRAQTHASPPHQDDHPPVMDDVAAMLAFTDRQNEVKKGPVGCHCSCMSGPMRWPPRARYPERIAAASFYGTWLVSEAEESPHLSFGKVKGEPTAPAPEVYREVCQHHPDATVIVPPRSSAVASATAKTASTKRDRHLQPDRRAKPLGLQRASGYNWRAWVGADIAR